MTTVFAPAASQASRASGVPVRFDTAFASKAGFEVGRFRLDNGLTLLVMPDRRAPVFAYQTWFRVGSRDEEPQRTGLAHLFEHLMFKGTKRHAPGTFDRAMESRGAQTNAATWVDWTFYHQALAMRADHLECVIDFEADRMQGLILDETTFRSELEVVKNERRMSVDDSIGGTLSERLFALAFERHPYRHSTIGAMEHLAAATVPDLRRFYETNYAPSNATVVVAGDVDVAHTLALLARSYGPLPGRNVVRPVCTVEPRQVAPRRGTFERELTAPQIAVGFHSPGQRELDYAALEMLLNILVAGDSARLYRALVTELELATDVEGFVPPFAEPGLAEFMITARRGVDPERILEALHGELARIGDGITDQEMRKARNQVRLASYEGLKDAESVAESLGHFETNFGEFSLTFTLVDRYGRIGHDDLRRVAAATFRFDNSTTIIAVPHATTH